MADPPRKRYGAREQLRWSLSRSRSLLSLALSASLPSLSLSLFSRIRKCVVLRVTSCRPGFRVHSPGLRVQVSWFRVQVSGFRVRGTTQHVWWHEGLGISVPCTKQILWHFPRNVFQLRDCVGLSRACVPHSGRSQMPRLSFGRAPTFFAYRGPQSQTSTQAPRS